MRKATHVGFGLGLGGCGAFVLRREVLWTPTTTNDDEHPHLVADHCAPSWRPFTGTGGSLALFGIEVALASLITLSCPQLISFTPYPALRLQLGSPRRSYSWGTPWDSPTRYAWPNIA